MDLGSLNGLNLYCYCYNNPVNKYDPTGQFPWLLVLIVVAVCSVSLESDSTHRYESNISEFDLNINGNNPEGKIVVDIIDNSFQIVDSYKYNNKEDMRKILEIIMNSDAYKSFGYTRTEKSYLSEWKAHNVVYSIFPKGDWGKRAMSVDLNKNLKDDKYWYIYWLF